MSALGQKQTSPHVRVMSALPPKADITLDVRYVRTLPGDSYLLMTRCGSRAFSYP